MHLARQPRFTMSRLAVGASLTCLPLLSKSAAGQGDGRVSPLGDTPTDPDLYEAVFTGTTATEGFGAVSGEVTYEQRFGARDQLEVVVSFAFRETEAAATTGGSDWDAGLGDVAVGWKRVLLHSLESGTIASVTGEAILPTGDESEGFWRAALGKTFTQGPRGRAWSPMVEVLGSTDLDTGDTTWDLARQLRVTLNRRQHVMADLLVRFPLDETDSRSTGRLLEQADTFASSSGSSSRPTKTRSGLDRPQGSSEAPAGENLAATADELPYTFRAGQDASSWWTVVDSAKLGHLRPPSTSAF